MKASAQQGRRTSSLLIDGRIKELADWRGELLGRLRALIKGADPEVTEDWKWRGVPVWEHAGIICTGETYKNVVKLTFARGAALDDPTGLFNSSLDGNTRRAIDFQGGRQGRRESIQSIDPRRRSIEHGESQKAVTGPTARTSDSDMRDQRTTRMSLRLSGLQRERRTTSKCSGQCGRSIF